MKPKLTIGHFPIIDHLILGIAASHDGGHFTNFELATRMFYNWDAMVREFETDKLDGAFMLFPLALDLFHRNMAAKIVLLGQREGQAIVARRGIHSLKELKGKTVLIPHTFSVHHLLAHEVFSRAGLDPERDVHYRIGFEDVRSIPSSLESDGVDAFVSAEPWNTLAIRSGFGHVVGSLDTFRAHHVCCVLILKDEVIEKQNAACQELIESLVRAGMFASAYPRQAAEIAENFIECPKSIALQALTRHQGSAMFWDLLPRLEDFNDLQDIAVDNMRLWEKKLDLARWMAPEFAQHAYRAWVIAERKTTKDKGERRTVPGSVQEALHRLPGTVPLVGLSTIAAGQKFPRTSAQDTVPEFTTDIVEAALHGRNFKILNPAPGFKAFVVGADLDGRDPDVIFLKLGTADADKILTALRLLGNGIDMLKPADEKDFFSASRAAALWVTKEGSWLRLSSGAFKLLPLLIDLV